MVHRKQSSKAITSDSTADFLPVRLQVRYIRVPVRWQMVRCESQPAPWIPGAHFMVGQDWEPLAGFGVRLIPTVAPAAVGDIQLDPFNLRSQFLKLDVGD